jgi:hypothetical protein
VEINGSDPNGFLYVSIWTSYMGGIVSVGFGFHAISILEGINGMVWILDPL